MTVHIDHSPATEGINTNGAQPSQGVQPSPGNPRVMNSVEKATTFKLQTRALQASMAGDVAPRVVMRTTIKANRPRQPNASTYFVYARTP